jgi:putative ABC transport system ATP-binding protein
MRSEIVLLEVNNLTKRYPGPTGIVNALDGVSLSLDAGQFVAVRGPSGCGKTTLLLVIGSLLRPTDGTVQLEGEDPYQLVPGRRAAFRSRHIGFVFQQFHLVPYLSVLENILAPVLASALPNAHERAWELIRQFRLEHRARHVPAMLSTGERQRAAIARATLNRPRLLLADEPTGNLDGESAAIVLTHLAEFAKAGGAVLLMTHDDRASAYAERQIQMDRGKIVA